MKSNGDGKYCITDFFYDIFPYIAVSLYYFIITIKDRSTSLQEWFFMAMVVGGIIHLIAYEANRFIVCCYHLVRNGLKCFQYTEEEWENESDPDPDPETDEIPDVFRINEPGYIKWHILIMIAGAIIAFV